MYISEILITRKKNISSFIFPIIHTVGELGLVDLSEVIVSRGGGPFKVFNMRDPGQTGMK